MSKEKEIIQKLYDEGYLDFSGEEDNLIPHADLTLKGILWVYKFAEKETKKAKDEEFLKRIENRLIVLRQHSDLENVGVVIRELESLKKEI